MKKNLLLLTLFLAFAACKKESNSPSTNNTGGTKIAPDGFKFATARNVSLSLSLKAGDNTPISGVIVSVYNPSSITPGTEIFKGATDKNGNLTGTISVAASVNQLVIDPRYIGLIRDATANINNNSITATIGGKTGFSGDITANSIVSKIHPASLRRTVDAISTGPAFSFPSPYTSLANAVVNTSTYPASLGRPAYLQPVGDVIPATMLGLVNASFPEGVNEAVAHPSYLSSNVSSIINVTTASDVYVTFVSEGAAFTSTIAYYTYPTNNPPKTAAAITNATYIFPNASAYGSGGGLLSGDKVKLGTFPAGTSIGYMLLQNAFTPTGINNSVPIFYGQDNLNPTGLRQAVTIYDNVDNVLLTGFEDLNRAGDPIYPSDNDFNDVVIYTTTTTPGALSTGNLPTVDKITDTDGDGVPDYLDAFPTDPTKAFVYYFPSQSTYAQIAFEDNWPNKGDYDMNDLVLNYRYTYVCNAQNNVVTMQGEYNVAAAGASFKNGFGVQMPFPPSLVKSVTGQKAISNYIQLASNGVEAGQTNAVIIPFDNYNALISYPDGSFLINTVPGKAVATSSTASVLVTFTTPIAPNFLVPSALNPFLISNLRRGYEIHLPGYSPTSLANTKLFGTGDDASNGGTTYVSKENWPWAISFNGTFSYPTETSNISLAYPNFLTWASSGGSQFADWYSNTGAGYRNSSYIFVN